MTQCTVGVIGYILERFTLYWRSEQKKKKKCICKCVFKSQTFTWMHVKQKALKLEIMLRWEACEHAMWLAQTELLFWLCSHKRALLSGQLRSCKQKEKKKCLALPQLIRGLVQLPYFYKNELVLNVWAGNQLFFFPLFGLMRWKGLNINPEETFPHSLSQSR